MYKLAVYMLLLWRVLNLKQMNLKVQSLISELF